jgi:hypothetical protein
MGKIHMNTRKKIKKHLNSQKSRDAYQKYNTPRRDAKEQNYHER